MVGTVLLFETSPEISNRDIAGSTLVESAVPSHADVVRLGGAVLLIGMGAVSLGGGRGPRLLPSFFLSTYCCSSTTASQYSNTFCCRRHKGEVYIMLQDITSTLILGQYF